MSRLKNIFLAKWHPYAWIIGVGFALYFKSLYYDFTYLDDNALIINNGSYLTNLGNIFKAFREDVFRISFAEVYYRPMLIVSFIVDAQFGGVEPFYYHLTNIVVHLAVSSVLFLLLSKMGYRRSLALVFGLIFAIHPVLVQAVSWIPGRNDSLLTLFGLVSFLLLVEFANGQSQKDELTPGMESKYFGHIIFFLFALFTKESALLIAPISLLYLILVKKEKIASFNQQIIGIGYIIPVIAWYFARRSAFSDPMQLGIKESVLALIGNLPSAIQFIGKVFLPFNLAVLSTIKDTSFVYGGVAILLIVLAIFFSKHKKWSNIAFGLMWFFGFLLPTMIFHNSNLRYGYDYSLEHRIYLSMLGVFIILLEIDWIKSLNFNKFQNVLLLEVLVAACAVVTFFHQGDFRNRLTFWQKAAKSAPHSPLAQRNLGAMYYLDGNFDQAEVQYRKALDLNPAEEMAHGNLGLIYAARGDNQRAEEEYKKELEINPNYDNGHFNLALLYYQQGKVEEAQRHWLDTISINPNYTDAYNNLILSYYNQQKNSEAKYILNQAQSRGVQISPQLIGAVNSAGSLNIK